MIGRILLTLFPISLLISTGVSEFITIAIAIIFFINFYVNKKLIKDKYLVLLLFFWLSLILNLILSENFTSSFSRNIFFFRYIIFIYFIISIFKNKKNHNSILLFWLLTLFVVCFDIYFEYFNGKNILGIKSIYNDRIASFLGKELKIGHFVLGFIFICLGYYFDKFYNYSRNHKIFGFLLLIFCMIALCLTGERSNTIKGLLGIFIFVSLGNKKVFKYKKIILTFFIISPIIIYLSSNKIQGRFNNIILPIKDKGIISAIKETQHGAHFYTAIEIFKTYPLFGVGNRNFRDECLKEKYFNKDYKQSNVRCATHPHQIYFELLSEHGIIGTTIIISVIFYILFQSFLIYKKNQNLAHLGSIIFVLISFLPILPSGSFFTSWGASIFWLNFSIMIFYNNKSNIRKSIKN
jgi:O-antigen ligase